MAWVSYERIVEGTGISGKYGETLRVPEKWQIRTDSPATSKLAILNGVSGQIGVTYGTPHSELPQLLAMEFDLSPVGRDGMRWILTVQYYTPANGKRPTENGIPEDSWERQGGSTSVPAFTDIEGETITNSAGDPIEGLERERPERSWSHTKYYADDANLDADISAADGRVNDAAWADGDPKTWKCYFKGAKRVTTTRLDGDDDGGVLEYIESQWEFRYDPLTWKLMPWDVGFMELAGSGGKQAITTSDGKSVKQPVALDSGGLAQPPGTKPSVINDGDGADVYDVADFDTIFGPPRLMPEGNF